MSRGLLDTSVFIAREQRRPLGDNRALRAETLALARAADPMPIGEAVIGAFARLVHDCRRAGARPRILDALIAATAIEHGLPVVTQDDDFAAMRAAHPALDVLPV